MFRSEKHSNTNPASTETTNNLTPHAGTPNTSPYDVNARSQTTLPSSTTSRATTESEALARDIKEGILNGFVGNGTVLTGEATFKGMLRVDGHLSGKISSQDGTLIVGTNGKVEANIEVAVAQIYGTVNGDVIASKRVEMGRAAKVTGNIQTPALAIEQGAVFEGSCRMLHLKNAQEKQRQHDRVAGAPAAPKSSEPAKSPEAKINWSAALSGNGSPESTAALHD